MEQKITISVDVNNVLTYALQQNGSPLVREISLKNETDADYENLMVRVSTDGELIEPFTQGIQVLKSGEEIQLRNLKIQIKGDYLASLTERISCNVKIEIFQEEQVLAADVKPVIVLAYDEWPGLKYFPDILAAFITPNHPIIAELVLSASKWLEKWTKSPSLDGYQSQNQNRVKLMAAAVYAAIQERNITYAVHPASFEQIGQRIRLADTVMEQHMGNCMDMTLLYAACLESMGLNPILILMNGHIFAGVWLVDDSFSDPITEDPTQLEKRMAKGIHELLAVECTMMCAGKTNAFDTAAKTAEQQIGNYRDFVFAIDIRRARKSGVRPLPIRVKNENGYTVQHENRSEKEITAAPDLLDTTFSYDRTQGNEQVTKVFQWERKLLDLSLRNMLINMRLTRSVVPLLSGSLSDLEDALAEGEEFQVLPRPLEWELAEINTFTLENTNHLGPYAELIALECKHKKLHTIYSEKELNSTLTKIYRSAKTSMEENGASTLYMVMGLLRWFEDKSSKTPKYAPLVLVPIDIIRKSASKGYVLRMRDEDAQINITLLEFLKQNFDIKINGLNPLPMDEHGLDMKKIFATVRYGVMEETMWEVIESGFIGNFSFSQFVMWNDIHNRADILERNKIVRSLINGAVDWDCTLPEQVDTDEAYLPITVDASQLRAINMAANGVSFVLHGPPGTGKSQTITAMIANALAKGKSILFVAEKMAALEVVERRLSALGIGDFCLELHSNKAVKKSVLDQLKRGLEIRKSTFETEYNKKIEDIRAMRSKLDSYVQALHKHRPFGMSMREMIDFYETIPEHNIELRFDREFAAGLSQSDLNNQRYLLERLAAAGQVIGHPYNHPLEDVKQTIYSQSLKLDMEDVLMTYKKRLREFQDCLEQFADVMGINVPVREEEWRQLCVSASGIISAEEVPTFLMEEENLYHEFKEPYLYLQKKKAFDEKKEVFKSRWNENFLRMDMKNFQKKYEDAGHKFFGKGRAFAALTAEIQAYAFFNVAAEQIPVLLTDVSFYQEEQNELEEMQNRFSEQWKEILKQYDCTELLQAYEKKVRNLLDIIAPFKKMINTLKQNGRFKECMEKAKSVLTAKANMERSEEKLADLLDISFDKTNINWFEGREETCDKILDHKEQIKDWIVYRQFSMECRNAGLGVVCDAYESGMPHEHMLDSWSKSIYKAMILAVIEQEPALNGFTGTGFNELIQQFKKLDQEFMELTKEEMVCRLTQNLPDDNESVQISKELNILRRAISSNGRGLSIRTLFDQIPHVLQKVCPCMLMSPISVAQFLSVDNELFDIVIFDEASQLPTCKAVGVLARGKNAVIVGDPNQMPPTSFFAGNTVDEDNLDIEDLDSILDDCLALGMPQTHLKWHYRSRHESLIAFSNQEFYENSMLTFPSVNDRERRVRLVKADGFFERGKARVNQGEAAAIVNEILHRYRDPALKDQTMGVVTFNTSQQILIEDLLQVEFQKNADFDLWANSGDEALFVKNLENVQGDERDVILFSVAFGPDADGKMSLNFGPINNQGGWKRLNVAVSRARSEMVVFSIMTADMIDLKRTRSRGVEALKNFLEFAENGKLQSDYKVTLSKKKQGILERICKELASAGYQYQKNVGHSDFKIDIAVVNPYNEDEYLMGIMLDGDSYRQSTNTKDREVAQINVLTGLGWDLCRIWTMDWWDNRTKELEKLFKLLEEKKTEAFGKFKKTVVSINEGDDSEGTLMESGIESDRESGIESNVVQAEIDANSEESFMQLKENKNSKPYKCMEYQTAVVPVTPMPAADYIDKKAVKQIADKLQIILDVEAPVEVDRLIKKTLRGFGINRTNPQVVEATEKALKKVPFKAYRQNGKKFYYTSEQTLDAYSTYRIDVNMEDKRGLDEICVQELKNAVCITLQKKGEMLKDDLVRETIRTMGYSRSRAALVDAVGMGLKYGVKTGEIGVDEKKIYYLK